MARIVLDNVCHRYRGASIDTLHGLNLEIASGTAHALLGSSGAGKSTLLNLLSGLEVPSSGRIFIDGQDVSRIPPRRRHVSQVFQFPVLYDSLSVAENLEFPLKTRRVSNLDRRQRVAAIAEQLSIAQLLGAMPASLSLFEKQLVAIGRELIRPEVSLVLLDEPLTAVEPATKWRLRRVLKSAQADLGATMIYVTHDQTEALTFADAISVLHDGEILQTGSAERLFNDPDHEHVADFIGSPGMNLVAGEIVDGDYRIAGHSIAEAPGLTAGPCTVGFRPEWAVAVRRDGNTDGEGVPVRVIAVRVHGVRDRRPVGVVTAELGGKRVNLRQELNLESGDQALLQIDSGRVVGFRNGRRLGAGSNGAGAAHLSS